MAAGRWRDGNGTVAGRWWDSGGTVARWKKRTQQSKQGAAPDPPPHIGTCDALRRTLFAGPLDQTHTHTPGIISKSSWNHFGIRIHWDSTPRPITCLTKPNVVLMTNSKNYGPKMTNTRSEPSTTSCRLSSNGGGTNPKGS